MMTGDTNNNDDDVADGLSMLSLPHAHSRPPLDLNGYDPVPQRLGGRPSASFLVRIEYIVMFLVDAEGVCRAAFPNVAVYDAQSSGSCPGPPPKGWGQNHGKAVHPARLLLIHRPSCRLGSAS